MKEEDINKPEGGADEITIEKNLKKLNYPAGEDITKQNEKAGSDLENTDE